MMGNICLKFSITQHLVWSITPATGDVVQNLVIEGREEEKVSIIKRGLHATPRLTINIKYIIKLFMKTENLSKVLM